MEKIAAIICRLAVELYNQLKNQIDNPEELVSFYMVAESKDGYCYKITISREGEENEE